MAEKQVGDARTFTFSDKTYKIYNVLDIRNINMQWTWDTSTCPHCKQKITRTTTHNFYRIEILADNSIAEKDVTIDDLVIVGDTYDGRKMILPKDKYSSILNQSKQFKHLIK